GGVVCAVRRCAGRGCCAGTRRRAWRPPCRRLRRRRCLQLLPREEPRRRRRRRRRGHRGSIPRPARAAVGGPRSIRALRPRGGRREQSSRRRAGGGAVDQAATPSRVERPSPHARRALSRAADPARRRQPRLHATRARRPRVSPVRGAVAGPRRCPPSARSGGHRDGPSLSDPDPPAACLPSSRIRPRGLSRRRGRRARDPEPSALSGDERGCGRARVRCDRASARMSGPYFPDARVLVTGGAGFIGSHVVDALVERGQAVTVLDDFSSGGAENWKKAEPAIEIVEGDLCDGRVLERALRSADVVLHLATRCVRLSLSDPAEVHRVNSEGTHRLLLEAVRRRVRRFVYVSSSEGYRTAVTVPMTGEPPLEPTTMYGATKLLGELYTKAMTRSFGLPTVVVRPFNPYGPRAHFEGVYGEVIPRFTVRLLNGRPPVIFGDGLQTRDFTYVGDTVRGILLAAAVATPTAHVFNI